MLNSHPKSPARLVLALFERSWGEVEWVLPVIIKLLELRPDWKFYAILSPLWKQYNPVVTNRTLESELAKVASQIVLLDNNTDEIPGIEDPAQVQVLICDKGEDNEFKLTIQRRFPGAKVVIHPHGTGIIPGQKFNHPRRFNEWEKVTQRHDLSLVQIDEEKQWSFDRISHHKQSAIGFPPHDHWWIQHLLDNDEIKSSEELQRSSTFKRAFVFFARGPEREFTSDAFSYVAESVAEAVLKHNDTFLMIKPHPRQDVRQLASFYEKYDKTRWMLTSLHSLQLAAISDFVISVWSSCVADSLCLQKPVVEFHQFWNPTSALVTDRTDRTQSFARLAGFAVAANTKEQLEYYITNFFDPNADHSIWLNQRMNFERTCHSSVDSSSVAARRIIATVEPELENMADIPAIQEGGTPWETSSCFFTDSSRQEGPSDLILQLKRIKAPAMPVNRVVLNEIAKAFALDAVVITGTFSEHLADEAAQIFKEVHLIEIAADLYQSLRFAEIAPHDNVKVHTSASVLTMLLPRLHGRCLFILGTHAGMALPTRANTMTPILEELKVLSSSGRKEDIILITDLRYFQPVQVDAFEACQFRKYPSINEVRDLLKGWSPAYQMSVLGDVALCYPSDAPIQVSPAIQAVTNTRFIGDSRELSVEAEASENFLAFNLTPEERAALSSLHQDFDSPEEMNVGGHYWYWHGLLQLGLQNYGGAAIALQQAFARGFQHPHVLALIQLATQKSLEAGPR